MLQKVRYGSLYIIVYYNYFHVTIAYDFIYEAFFVK